MEKNAVLKGNKLILQTQHYTTDFKFYNIKHYPSLVNENDFLMDLILRD